MDGRTKGTKRWLAVLLLFVPGDCIWRVSYVGSR